MIWVRGWSDSLIPHDCWPDYSTTCMMRKQLGGECRARTAKSAEREGRRAPSEKGKERQARRAKSAKREGQRAPTEKGKEH